MKPSRLCILSTLTFVACLSPVFAADEAASPTNAPAFAPTVPNNAPPPKNAPAGMVWIPGGEFSMGCKLPSQGCLHHGDNECRE